jgi:hypothetical protein
MPTVSNVLPQDKFLVQTAWFDKGVEPNQGESVVLAQVEAHCCRACLIVQPPQLTFPSCLPVEEAS